MPGRENGVDVPTLKGDKEEEDEEKEEENSKKEKRAARSRAEKAMNKGMFQSVPASPAK